MILKDLINEENAKFLREHGLLHTTEFNIYKTIV